MKVSFYEGEHETGFLIDVVDVRVPGEMAVKSYSKIFSCVMGFEVDAMYVVRKLKTFTLV